MQYILITRIYTACLQIFCQLKISTGLAIFALLMLNDAHETKELCLDSLCILEIPLMVADIIYKIPSGLSVVSLTRPYFSRMHMHVEKVGASTF